MAVDIAATTTAATGAQSFHPIRAGSDAPVVPEARTPDWLGSTVEPAAEAGVAAAGELLVTAAATLRDCDNAARLDADDLPGPVTSSKAATITREESVSRLSLFKSLRMSAAP